MQTFKELDRVFAPSFGAGTVRFTSQYSVGQYCDVNFDDGSFRKVLSEKLLPLPKVRS